MAMKHALLGLVIEEPGTAADIERRFNQRFGFWRPASSAHPDLHWLRKRGKVRAIEREIDGRHGSRVWYEATGAGVEWFSAWLLESVGPEAPPLRSNLLLKLEFAGASVELLEVTYADAGESEQWCVQRINALAERGDLVALARREKEMDELSPVLVRDAEMAYLQATIQYLQEIRRELRRVYERRTGRRLEA